MSADNGQKMFENVLMPVIAEGVNVILDYLRGDSAFVIISALAKTNTDLVVQLIHQLFGLIALK